LIRYVAGGALFAVLSYIGVGIEAFYKKRTAFFKEFAEFLSYAEREVTFLKTDFLALISGFIKDKKTLFSKILDDIKIQTEKGLPLLINTPYLTPEEKTFVAAFFEALGKSDFEAGSRLIKRYSLEAGERITGAEKQKRRRGSLSKSCASSGGSAF